MHTIKNKVKGFTLFEMLLVLVIMSSIIMLLANYTSQRLDQFRRDRTALQMQQILNAGMAFYINNSYWPAQSSISAACGTVTTLASLQPNYLPSNLVSPWSGAAYSINCNTTSGTFTVSLTIPGASSTRAAANAKIIAGMIPLGSVSTATITGMVNVPGQNLNNARSVNFAGYYHNGGCVPAPTCPTGMAPDILVMPVSLYGVNDVSSSSAYYPLYGFTAFAYGAANGTTAPSSSPAAPASVADCYTPAGAATACSGGASTINPNYLYWRVCLSVTTEKGVVAATADSSWGSYAVLVAFTRCVPSNENSGSDFTVWTR